MKRLKIAKVEEAIEKIGNNPEVLAKELGISKAQAYYWLRKVEEESSKQSTKGDISAGAINRLVDKNPTDFVSVIPANINPADYIPQADPNYKKREVDAEIMSKIENGISTNWKHYGAMLLVGEAGTGKSYMPRQIAAETKKPFLRIACDDSAILKEFIGKREIISGTTYFRMGALIELLQVPSIILLDEVNCLPPSKQFFLHELLEPGYRKIFLKDAGSGKVINVHPECSIFLSCNPVSGRYAGTNKFNVALVDRCMTVPMEQFKTEDMENLFKTNSEENTESLKRFYSEVLRVIKEQGLRAVISLRSIQRISHFLKNGDSVKTALSYGFYNSAIATASEREMKSLEDIAKICFGAKAFEEIDSE